MGVRPPKLDKALYKELRQLNCQQLWDDHVASFDRAPAAELNERVATVRAVGVVFAASGTAEQKSRVRQWLDRLLHDPNEKIRRYAIAAIPKLGAGPAEESELLNLVRTTKSERERSFIQQSLEKIGGRATLEQIQSGELGGLSLQTERKIRANISHSQDLSTVRLDALLLDFQGVPINLRCRIGLEQILRGEVEQLGPTGPKLEIFEIHPGLVRLKAKSSFTLGDLYRLRCFSRVSFDLGNVRAANSDETVDALASVITSETSRRLLTTFSAGLIRYRLNFAAKGHQRSLVRAVANRAYSICPELLNDPRNSAWEIAIYPSGRGSRLELFPPPAADLRFDYRQGDVPAASHPPLAACLARLAGKADHEIVWDPFCGSGLELIERALLGGVQSLYGTDTSTEAVAMTRANLGTAKLPPISTTIQCCDFRDAGKFAGLGPSSVSLVVTNPPLGKRIPIANLDGLIVDLFAVAAQVLQPDGRLVLVNPSSPARANSSLKLQSSRTVDAGIRRCRLEVYRKIPEA